MAPAKPLQDGNAKAENCRIGRSLLVAFAGIMFGKIERSSGSLHKQEFEIKCKLWPHPPGL